MKRTCCAFFLLATASCASSTLQTEALLRQASNLPNDALIADVPFYPQAAHYCGPATLAMAINWAGKKMTVAEIAPQVYTPGMKGSLQRDMITSAERQGFLTIPISGLHSLLAEVAAGHPVIVFENLGLAWLPQYHYAIVLGYDLRTQEVILHSGPEAFKHWDLRKFERSWMLADYWGMVVLRPGELSAVADEVTHLKAASSLELLEKTFEAEVAYYQILKKWPDSVGAEIGLANTFFARKKYSIAIRHLQSAIQKRSDFAPSWYNLAIAQEAVGLNADSQKSKALANKLATPEQLKLFAKKFTAEKPAVSN